MEADVAAVDAARRGLTHLWDRRAPDPTRLDFAAIRSRTRREVLDDALERAAVLVAVARAPEGDLVLLTRRSAALRDHAGEVCFPGGKAQPGDANIAETAAREAFEEVGLAPDAIEHVALLDDVIIGGRFVTTPLVAVVGSQASLRFDAAEVEGGDWLPIGKLRAPGIASCWTDGDGRTHYAFKHPDLAVSGATARILHQLLNPGAGASASA